MTKRKPWRKFRRKRLKDKHIRWVCLAVIGAEIGVLKGQGRLHFPVIEVTEDREVVIYQPDLEEDGGRLTGEGSEIPPKDKVYGIRIRLKEGMVDFYRREELHDMGR